MNHHTFGEDRCHLRPRITQAQKLDQAVWEAVLSVLTDGDYLSQLAADFISQNESTDLRETATLERRLGQLRMEETSIVRALARRGELHDEVLQPALEEVTGERRTIEKELARVTGENRLLIDRTSTEAQLRQLAVSAQERLANPTPEMMTEVFDLLDLDLIRVEGGLYEGVGRLPLPPGNDADEGEVWAKEPPSII